MAENGQRNVNVNYYLEELINTDLNELNTRLNYIDAAVELSSAYDLRYGLDTGNNSVCMTSKEKATRGSLFEWWLEQYDFYKIKDRFGLSFLEYISLPSFKIESMNDTVLRISKKEFGTNK